GSVTGFSRDPPDLDGAVVDLAHFQFEQTANEIRMTPRNDNFRPADSVLDRDDVGAQAIANVVVFHHHALSLRHDRLKFSEIENHVGTIEPADRAANDFARAVLELFVNHFLLDLANALHHRLLGGLGRDA